MAARYVAIIMDGNARWAAEHGVPVLEGHREGAQALKQTVRNAVELDVLELTAYAFSTENWSRPRAEVEGLMAMFAELIESETPELDEEGVRMRFIGRHEGVSDNLLERMRWAEKQTAANRRMTLFVAFNYGGRAEILDAAARYRGGGGGGFKRPPYAPGMHRPDPLIPASGERRLSNSLPRPAADSGRIFT